MTHRVLATRHGLYVTELGTCAVAHLAPAFSAAGEGVDELADPYSLWGMGWRKTRLPIESQLVQRPRTAAGMPKHSPKRADVLINAIVEIMKYCGI